MTFGQHAIAQGDVLAALRELPDNSFDGTLFDPPYGLKFMAKKWDYDVPSVAVFAEMLRVLKPGAPLLSFGGTRTFHRVACNIEDAGFELRDCLMWMYGKGFPKSQNVSLAIDKAAKATRPVTGTRVLTGNAAITTKEKGGTYGVQVGSIPPKTIETTGPATELARQYDGYGTALKPGWEPIILARKPLDGTMVNNLKTWGCGPIAIDDCRIGGEGRTFKAPNGATKDSVNAYGDGLNGGQKRKFSAPCNDPLPNETEEEWANRVAANIAAGVAEAGRWPANVALAHNHDCRDTPNGEGCVDDCPIYLLNKQAGNRPSGKAVTRNGGGGKIFNGKGLAGRTKPDTGYSDSGGPARFYYCAKVSTKEREYGCEHLPKRSAGEATGGREEGSDGLKSPRAGAGRGDGAHNHHPTLKPLELTRWLASLIRPPTDDATLLVPYSGAGSEIIGALQAGWPTVFGIEGEYDYITIANARVAAWGVAA